MTAKTVLMRPHGLRLRVRVPSCLPLCYATDCLQVLPGSDIIYQVLAKIQIV